MIDLISVGAVAFRSFAALILITAGLAKVRDLERFVGTVRDYRLAPAALAKPLAMAVVAAELVLGVGLLIPVWAWPSSMASTLLLLGFAAAVAVNLRRGRTALDCGCHFGRGKRSIGPEVVGRNLLLAAALAVTGPFSLGGALEQALVAWAAGGVAFLLYLTADLILAIAPLGVRRSSKSLRP